jgi:hypothetical protein
MLIKRENEIQSAATRSHRIANLGHLRQSAARCMRRNARPSMSPRACRLGPSWNSATSRTVPLRRATVPPNSSTSSGSGDMGAPAAPDGAHLAALRSAAAVQGREGLVDSSTGWGQEARPGVARGKPPGRAGRAAGQASNPARAAWPPRPPAEEPLPRRRHSPPRSDGGTGHVLGTYPTPRCAVEGPCARHRSTRRPGDAPLSGLSGSHGAGSRSCQARRPEEHGASPGARRQGEGPLPPRRVLLCQVSDMALRAGARGRRRCRRLGADDAGRRRGRGSADSGTLAAKRAVRPKRR